MAASQATTAMWGMPDKRNKGLPPKCFNIASRVQKSSIEQPLAHQQPCSKIRKHSNYMNTMLRDRTTTTTTT
ncbi:unnamed protein product [Polarella glacialis]|uniref:Uncharacterized protein n=1 Tax=Polarella glacialis TaxID=89957 RepID=A0A813HP18_POLGL|nr:unnamed protein product [Polarella glacialis]